MEMKADTVKKQISIILLGQAGSGRSNVLASLSQYLDEKKIDTFSINLDPLIESDSLFNINIRDSIQYDNIKDFYKFTHNKTLINSLNIFSIKFHQIMEILTKKSSSLEYIITDTPNPELFLWSSSGNVIIQTLTSTYPTVILYVVDSQLCQDPLLFLNAIIDACSLRMRYGLPLIVVFNKSDLIDWGTMKAWMSDSSALMEAIIVQEETISDMVAANVYNLKNICEEIQIIPMSALRNEGLGELIKGINNSRIEFEKCYTTVENKKLREIRNVKKQIDNLKVCQPLEESLNAPIRETYKDVGATTGNVFSEIDENFNDSTIEAYMEKNFFLFGKKES